MHQLPMWACAVGWMQGMLRIGPHWAFLFALLTVLAFGPKHEAPRRSHTPRVQLFLAVLLHGAVTTLWGGAVSLWCAAAGYSGETACLLTVAQVAVVTGWRVASGKAPLVWTGRLSAQQMVALRHGHVIALLSILIGFGDLLAPHWSWHPFALLSYYSPTTAGGLAAASAACPVSHDPTLCLTVSQWQALSAGILSPTVTEHTSAVRLGIEMAQKGIVINVVARDVEDRVTSLVQNVEALSQLVPHLAVVVFENDSADETRARWLPQFCALYPSTVHLTRLHHSRQAA